MLRRNILILAVATFGIAPQVFAECTGFGTTSTCGTTPYSAAYTTGGNNLVTIAAQFNTYPYQSSYPTAYPSSYYGGSGYASYPYASYPYSSTYPSYGGSYGSYPYSSYPSTYGSTYGNGSSYISPYGGYGYGGSSGYPASSYCSPYQYSGASTYGGSAYGSYYGSSYPSQYAYPSYGSSIYPSTGYGSSYGGGSYYGSGYPSYGSSYPSYGTCGGGYPSYGYGYGGGVIYNNLNIIIDITLPQTASNTTPRPMPAAPTWTSCGASWDPCPAGPTDRDPVNDPPDSVTPVPPSRFEEPRTGLMTH